MVTSRRGDWTGAMGATLDLTAGGETLVHAQLADSIWTRGRGLLGRRGLAPQEGLLIRPCSSVHTWFMRFAIDVVYLDADGCVTKVVPDLKPWRFSWGRGANMVLELPSGEAARQGIVPGMVLEGAAGR
jgi:uncharacterized membrane protein (UPF0127 family)